MTNTLYFKKKSFILLALLFSACSTFDSTKGKMKIDLKSFNDDVEYSNLTAIKEKKDLVNLMYSTMSYGKDLCNYPPTFIPEKVYFNSKHDINNPKDTIEFILSGRAKNAYGVEDKITAMGDIVRDGSFFKVVKY